MGARHRGRATGSGRPYAPAFLTDFEEKHCYDRCWDPKYRSWMTTRYLCAGHAFTVVTDTGSFADTLSTHFRHHYFQVALISQFQTAALHSLSERLSEAMDLIGPDLRKPNATARNALRAILLDLLRFTQKYWFADLTHQVQGREIVQWWRQHLDVAKLYDQVTREAAEANALLNRVEDERTAAAADRFGWIATIGATLGISVGFLGMNIIVPGSADDTWADLADWKAGALVLAGSLGLAILSYTALVLASTPGKPPPGGTARWRGWKRAWSRLPLRPLGGCALVIIGLLGFGLFWPVEPPPPPPRLERGTERQPPPWPEREDPLGLSIAPLPDAKPDSPAR